jgi:hypothetical protein
VIRLIAASAGAFATAGSIYALSVCVNARNLCVLGLGLAMLAAGADGKRMGAWVLLAAIFAVGAMMLEV